jgi:hypothetical protein
MLEYVCNENPRSIEHWVGKLSDAQRSAVRVDPNVLQKHVGVYVEQAPLRGTAKVPRIFEVSFADDALFVQELGDTAAAKTRLVSHSEVLFTNGGLGLEFVVDANGVATHLLDRHASGDYNFQRRK